MMIIMIIIIIVVIVIQIMMLIMIIQVFDWGQLFSKLLCARTLMNKNCSLRGEIRLTECT